MTAALGWLILPGVRPVFAIHHDNLLVNPQESTLKNLEVIQI